MPPSRTAAPSTRPAGSRSTTSYQPNMSNWWKVIQSSVASRQERATAYGLVRRNVRTSSTFGGWTFHHDGELPELTHTSSPWDAGRPQSGRVTGGVPPGHGRPPATGQEVAGSGGHASTLPSPPGCFHCRPLGGSGHGQAPELPSRFFGYGAPEDSTVAGAPSAVTIDPRRVLDVVSICRFHGESLRRNRGKSGHAPLRTGFSPAQSRYGLSPNARLAEIRPLLAPASGA